MSDNEIQEINNRKLKEKGAAVVKQQEQKYNPESLLLQVLELMRVRGLEAMNLSEEVKSMIYSEKQKKLNERVKSETG